MDLALTAHQEMQAQERLDRFKDSEAGPIPDDWEAVYVEDIASITTGSRNTQDRVAGGTYPFYVRSQNVERINSYSFDTEAVLTAGDGVGTGKIFHYIDGKFDVHQRVYVMSDFSDRISGYFFYLVFASKFYDRIMQMTAKSSVDSVRRDMVARMAIPLPPVREQVGIVEALMDADSLIVALEKLIEKKRLIRQGAMQELLSGRCRVPGFKGEWQEKTIKQIADCLDNLREPLSGSQRMTMRGPYPYCGANGVLDYIDSYAIEDDVILIAEDGGHFDEYDTRPIAYRMSGRFWVNNHAHILKAREGYSQDFLFYSLVHKDIRPFLASGTRAKLNKSEMYKITVRLPSDEREQDAIAEILAHMDSELDVLEARLEKGRQIREGMMQELLTGRVRLV
ncbi:restriction endonuclease subunit S [Lentisalinibacter salinarum]|uniref:restriction endonuclease subunit S n=1 Tax=Lentisalinibacter salinarum TaxID=2992239 RepID=UPI00386AFC89